MTVIKISRETAKEAVIVLTEQIFSWENYLKKYSGPDEEEDIIPAIEHLRFAIAALEADTIEII